MKEYLSFDDVLIKPTYTEISSIEEIDISTRISKNILLKIPIIASPMDTVCGSELAIELGLMGGLGIIHRNQTIESQVDEIKKVKQHCIVGAAVGIEDIKRVEEVIKAGADILILDYAIGYSEKAFNFLKNIKNKYDIDVISASLTTEDVIKRYNKIKLNTFRFGISNGKACISRNISGVGMPLFSALLEISKKIKKNNFLIADSGIRDGGDISKSLAAGASAVMLGSLLSATFEALGNTVEVEGIKYKEYRGMGTKESMLNGSSDRYNQQNKTVFYPEGINMKLPIKGTVKEVVSELIYGIKTSMLKVNAKNLDEFRKKVNFIKVTKNFYDK